MPDESYYLRWKTQVTGPHSPEDILALLESGRITKHHQISGDKANWEPLNASAVFAEHCHSSPSPGGSVHASGFTSQTATGSTEKKLRLQNSMDGLPNDRWYYAANGESAGPVDVDELHRLAQAGHVTQTSPLCREGDETWSPAAELVPAVFGFVNPPKTSTSPDSMQTVPTSHRPCPYCGEQVLAAAIRCRHCHSDFLHACPHCGEQVLATAIRCRHCGLALNNRASRNPAGGIGRLSYFLGLIGISLISGILEAAGILSSGLDVTITLTIISIALNFVLTIARLQNIGMNSWLSLLLLVPIGNLFLFVMCITRQENYHATSTLDGAGKVVEGILIALLGLFILALVVIVVVALNQ